MTGSSTRRHANAIAPVTTRAKNVNVRINICADNHKNKGFLNDIRWWINNFLKRPGGGGFPENPHKNTHKINEQSEN